MTNPVDEARRLASAAIVDAAEVYFTTDDPTDGASMLRAIDAYAEAIRQEERSRPGARKSVATKLGQVYDTALVLARAYARELGYAVAVHGSEIRDFDLVAVPWTDEAVAPQELAEAIREHVGGWWHTAEPSRRPHGRLTWSIHLGPTGDALDAVSPYIDLSVMPPVDGSER